MKKAYIANPVIARLPRYFRFIQDLDANGVSRISSSAIAEQLGLTASQVRQDFGCFGEFGQKGYGYNVPKLIEELGEILGLNRELTAIIIGCGNLGRALINNFEFSFCGIRLIGAFDSDPELVGEQIHGLTVQDVSELDAFVAEQHPIIAVLTVPSDQSQAVANQLARDGIRGIWNFTKQEVTVDNPGVVIENVILLDSLMTLSYRINEGRSL